MAVAVTRWLPPQEVADQLEQALPGSVAGVTDIAVEITPASLRDAATFLRDDPDLDLSFLSNLTAVDWDGRLEVVYHLQSLDHNHILTIRASAGGYDTPSLPSLEPVFHGAILQEREAYDLFGIKFEGHPDLRRMFLWEGFPGYPLRKSFLNMPGNLSAGLPGFSHESGGNDWPVPGTVSERPVHPNQQARTGADIPTPGEPPRLLGDDQRGAS